MNMNVLLRLLPFLCGKYGLDSFQSALAYAEQQREVTAADVLLTVQALV
jgi:hypothetical protein